MGSLQGTKFSPHNTILYESLGPLLKDYRQWRQLTQERLAELIGVGVRELRNWEAGHRRAGTENLHDISEFTGIPMQVCLALNANQPIWYSLRKRMFMYSSMEEAQFYSREFFRQRNKSEKDTLLKNVTIAKDKHIDMILSCHQDLYGSKLSLKRDVIKAAIRIIPVNNNIFFDSWGHYVGHQVCLPLKKEVYQELKKQSTIEDYLTSEMICDIIALGGGVFFYYSTFAANITASSRLTLDGLRALSQIKHKERYLLASHAVTTESAITHEQLGMKLVTDYAHLHTDVRPVIYERALDFHMKPHGAFRWVAEDDAEAKLAENLTRRTKQVWSPAIPVKDRATFPPLKKYSKGETAEPDALKVGRRHDTLTVATSFSERRNRNCEEKPKCEITVETCPNIKCTLYAESGKGNIISNGTCRSKDGTTLRRFICKACGKSFRSSTSNIFFGLRSPDEKVLEALKLLLKGLSLRGVAEIIGNDYRTIRSWLTVATEQSERINTVLIKELKVPQVELDALWAFVKSNSLRNRPLLGRPR